MKAKKTCFDCESMVYWLFNTLSQQPRAINQNNRRSTEAIKQNKGQVVWVITDSFEELNRYAEISLTGHLARANPNLTMTMSDAH